MDSVFAALAAAVLAFSPAVFVTAFAQLVLVTAVLVSAGITPNVLEFVSRALSIVARALATVARALALALAPDVYMVAVIYMAAETVHPLNSVLTFLNNHNDTLVAALALLALALLALASLTLLLIAFHCI